MNLRTHFLLRAGFIAVLLLVVVSNGFALLRLEKFHRQFSEFDTVYHRQLNLLHIMRNAVRERILSIQSMLLVEDPFEREEWSMRQQEFASQFITVRQELEKGARQLVEKELLQTLHRNTVELAPLWREVLGLLDDSEDDAATQVMSQSVVLQQQVVLAAFDDLESYYQALSEQQSKIIQEGYLQMRHYLVLLLIVLVALSVSVGVYTHRR